jgi:hypothetical protein
MNRCEILIRSIDFDQQSARSELFGAGCSFVIAAGVEAMSAGVYLTERTNTNYQSMAILGLSELRDAINLQRKVAASNQELEAEITEQVDKFFYDSSDN